MAGYSKVTSCASLLFRSAPLILPDIYYLPYVLPGVINFVATSIISKTFIILSFFPLLLRLNLMMSAT